MSFKHIFKTCILMIEDYMYVYLKNYNVYILPKIQIALSIWSFIPIYLSVQNQ